MKNYIRFLFSRSVHIGLVGAHGQSAVSHVVVDQGPALDLATMEKSESWAALALNHSLQFVLLG